MDGYKDIVSKYDGIVKENEALKAQAQMLGDGVGASSNVKEGGTGLRMGQVVEEWGEDKRSLEAQCLALKKQVEVLSKASTGPSSGQQLEGDEIQKLHEENMKLTDELEVVRTQCASSEEALAKVDSQLSTLSKENERIQLEAKEESNKLRAELGGKEVELASVNADLVRCQAAMERELAELKDENESLLNKNAELRSLSQNPSHIQGENAELKESNEKLRASLEKERKQANKLRAELDGKEVELASVNADLVRCQAAMERELAELKDENESLLNKNAELRSLSQNPSHIQGENAELKESNEKLRASLEKERKQANKLRAELDGKEVELASVNADLVRCQASMERELAEVKHEKESLLTENAELRSLSQNPSHYQELKGENAELKEGKEKLSASLEKERQMNAQLKEKSRELQQQLAMATDKDRLMAVQRKVQEYKRERDQLRAENEKMQHRMQGLQHTQDLIQGHLVQFNTVKENMERYKAELEQAQMEKERLAEENAHVKSLYQEHCGEIPPLLLTSSDLEEQEEETTSESDVLATATTKVPDVGEWKPLDDDEEEECVPDDDDIISGKVKRGGAKVGSVQEKLEQVVARPKSPGGHQPGASPKISHKVGNLEESDVPALQPNVVTVVTGERKIRCTYIHKGQSEKLGSQVLVKRNSGYDWGRLRYLPGEKDKGDLAGIELATPSKPFGFWSEYTVEKPVPSGSESIVQRAKVMLAHYKRHYKICPFQCVCMIEAFLCVV